MTTQWVLDEVATITERNIQLLKHKFSGMSQGQLSWKPTESTWSITEVFAHLNEYARFYHEAFHRRIDRTRFREPRENFVSSPLGRSAWVSMKLGNAKNIKRRFKASKAYDPLANPQLLAGNQLEILLAGQQELIKVLEKALAVNIRKVKVPIAMSKIVRLRLGDALLFVAYHNERHFQQAINITKMAQFPKK